MELLDITPYPMPTEADLPPSNAASTVDPGRAALLVLGMQPRFLRAFPADTAPGTALRANTRALHAAARAHGIPVVFGRAPAGPDPGNGAEHHGPGPYAGAPVPERGDHVVAYVRENAFLRSHLGRVLARAGRDQLLLCGLFAAGGVARTAADAREHGFETFVAADAVADAGPRQHRFALRWAATRCGAVRTTRSLIQEMERR
ncbi:isochorismatase family protein [Streptomyces sp. NPDC059917]|uniref:isochorismatase family protein n=1 Tax=Streptomyces sp. NPDC059917 TaxID=3347002 RepID=UPI00365D4780